MWGPAGYEGYDCEDQFEPEHSFGMAQHPVGWVLDGGVGSGEETWYFAGCVLASTGWSALGFGWGQLSVDCPDEVSC